VGGGVAVRRRWCFRRLGSGTSSLLEAVEAASGLGRCAGKPQKSPYGGSILPEKMRRGGSWTEGERWIPDGRREVNPGRAKESGDAA